MENQRGFGPLLIIVIVAAVLIAGVGGYMVLNKNGSSTPPSTSMSATTAPTQQANGVFGSIQDALSKSLSLQCNYTDATGRKTVTYIKAGSMRVDYSGASEPLSGSMIMKGGKIYMWQGEQGVVMAFDMSDITKNTVKAPPDGQNPNDIVKGLEQYKKYCKPATVADSLFDVPTVVKFTDMSSMMKDIQKAMPSGVMNAQDAQKMQQEMQKKYMPSGTSGQ